MNEETLPILRIERFSSVDGKGIRTVVFLKGCPLDCVWCHNPESKKTSNEVLFDLKKCLNCGACINACPSNAQYFENGFRGFNRSLCLKCFRCVDVCPTHALEKCAENMSISDIVKVVEKDKAFYNKDGGVTLSGGEPTLHGELIIKLLQELKARGFNTAIETSGYFNMDLCEQLIGCVDTFLWDYKDTDAERHKLNTGVENKKILKNLLYIDNLGAKTVLRCILLKGINTEITHYEGIAKIYNTLKNCQGVEIIPYHPYGGTKNVLLGGKDNGKTKWMLSNADLSKAKKYLKKSGVKII